MFIKNFHQTTNGLSRTPGIHSLGIHAAAIRSNPDSVRNQQHFLWEIWHKTWRIGRQDQRMTTFEVLFLCYSSTELVALESQSWVWCFPDFFCEPLHCYEFSGAAYDEESIRSLSCHGRSMSTAFIYLGCSLGCKRISTL